MNGRSFMILGCVNPAVNKKLTIISSHFAGPGIISVKDDFR
jgi:hypothetical protein